MAEELQELGNGGHFSAGKMMLGVEVAVCLGEELLKPQARSYSL